MVTFLPTPIGNLEDITYRSIKILQEADVLFCEDTRVTKRLLTLLQDKLAVEFLKTQEFISLHSHNEYEKLESLDLALFEKSCVYVSDAGTPCVSDPGVALVQFCQKNSLAYQVLPGANATLPAFAMSGFNHKEFIFVGFLHNKGKQRQSEIEKLLKNPYPSIIYESPKRVLSLVEEISKIAPDRKLFLVKEISKKNEKFFKETAIELVELLKSSNLKGEWVVVVDASLDDEEISSSVVAEILDLDISLKDKSKILSKLTGEPAKQWYKKLL